MAFVIVAVIAAILLITSVRSQAAPAWSPLSTVAAPPAASEPWTSVPGGVDQAVVHGSVLVRAAALEATSSAESSATGPAASQSAPAAARGSSPVGTPSGGHHHTTAAPGTPDRTPRPPTARPGPRPHSGHHRGHGATPSGGHPAVGHRDHGHHDRGRHVGQQRVLRG